METDPRLFPTSPEASMMSRLASLEARVSAIEHGGNRRVYAGTAAPAIAAEDGSLYVRTSTHELFVRSNGTWRKTGTTAA